MIDRLIEFSLKTSSSSSCSGSVLQAGVCGRCCVLRLTLPDLSDNQVIVFTDWQGSTPQEVEDQITYPPTTTFQGLPGVKVVRSSSAFGFSMIFVIFNDDVDLYFARTCVLEQLNLVIKELPAGVVPTLGPDAAGV
jgi:copper/silver efflux system protein